MDNGLLRLNEAQQVMDMFGDHFGLNIVHVEGEQRFPDALKGENDPKRNVKSSAAYSWKCSTKKR